MAAAAVLVLDGGFESLLWAHAHRDNDRHSAPSSAYATIDDGVIISAPPTEYSLLARVGGVLRLDGRCLVVDVGPGQRGAIIWPAGTHWSPTEQIVTHPSGARLRLGDTFYTAGAYYPARKWTPARTPDPSWITRAIACGRRAGGDVVQFGPYPVMKE